MSLKEIPKHLLPEQSLWTDEFKRLLAIIRVDEVEKYILVDSSKTEFYSFAAELGYIRETHKEHVDDSEATAQEMKDLGPKKWAELHRRPFEVAVLPDWDWLIKFGQSIPCGDCKRKWLELVRQTPPDFSTVDGYFNWTVDRHNEVNRLLDKLVITYERARQIWCTKRIEPASHFFNADGSPSSLRNKFKSAIGAFYILNGPSFLNVDHSLLRQPGIFTLGQNNGPSTFRPNAWVGLDEPGRFLLSIWLDPNIMKFTQVGHRTGKLFNSITWTEVPVTVEQTINTHLIVTDEDFQANSFLTRRSFSCGLSPARGGARMSMPVGIKILYDLGFREIYLLGCDWEMDNEKPYHFEQQRTPGALRNNNEAYKKWTQRFTDLRPHFEQHGLTVYNCNPDSGLKVFDYLPLEEAISRNVIETKEPTAGLYERKAATPKLTLVTLTGDRQKALSILERWMARQEDDLGKRAQWIVVDDGETPMKTMMGQEYYHKPELRDLKNGFMKKLRWVLDSHIIKGEYVLFLEDDDYYGPRYLKTMRDNAGDFDLVGEGLTINYHVGTRSYLKFGNRGNPGSVTALASSMFRAGCLPEIRQTYCHTENSALDIRVWRGFSAERRRMFLWKDKPQFIGMKGLPGRPGITRRHRPDPSQRFIPDPELMFLRSMIGDDADTYAEFYDGAQPV